MDYDHVAKLVEQYHAGDRKAFDKLYSLMYNKQYYYAYKMTGDPYASEDITQDTFLKAYNSLNSLEDPKSFVRWLGRITYSCTIDYVRRHKANTDSVEEMNSRQDQEEQLLSDDTNAGNVEEDALREVRKKSVREALDSLSPELKSMVVLKYFDDYNDSEIAEIMNIPIGTVKSRLSGCRRQLSRKLQPVYSFAPFLWIMMFMKAESAGAGSAAAAAAVKKNIASKAAVSVLTAGVIVSPFVAAGNMAPQIMKISLSSKPEQAVSSETVFVDAASPHDLTDVRIAETGQQLTRSGDVYHGAIGQNGTYTVVVKDSSGKTAKQTFTVNNIDTEAPAMGMPEKSGDNLYSVKVSDSGSGLDWDAVTVKNAEGEAIRNVEVLQDKGSISCGLDELPATITVRDKAGNWKAQKIIYE